VQGFLDVDNAMLQDESLKDELAGTTAVAVILKDNRLYCVGTVLVVHE
jgi:protein phosphatase 2C family protein 2/3